LSVFERSLFDDPELHARLLYAQYWQNKLKDNEDVSYPDSLAQKIADSTDQFSFAYLKEALLVPVSAINTHM
jgi:transitional endoplasmic reticulum ATPase